ncbi:MAG: formylglycine-generating enzyme family protein [Elusimicrobiales bacterium]|jgi:formylglycine-generating enzyme required for sulfatase activity|nr:formylglycine-generating enzyme family protein [Elusimicrobiales bacterium]
MKKHTLLTAVLAAMAGSAYAADFTELQTIKASEVRAAAAEIPSPAAAGITMRAPSVSKNYAEAAAPIEWVYIDGGRFIMGARSVEYGFEDAGPAREVAIKSFYMSKTDVTVAQYAECVAQGACTEPGTGDYCNWGKPGRGNHPLNCVDWSQASEYAGFKGARLPSESEWEYAATSGGRAQKYPWGNDTPTCDRVVMNTNGSGLDGLGCGSRSTLPVCSKPAGNTAHGLCDMAGNVWQWVQDKYQDSYKGAPADGSAFEGAGSERVIRGGSFGTSDPRTLRAAYRSSTAPVTRHDTVGFRLAW